MKQTLLAILLMALTSCARTSFYHNGQKVASFEGDMVHSHYEFVVRKDGSYKITWDSDGVSHSEPTRADSGRITAAAGIITAAGVAAAGL
jgi:hypothetical protein